MRSPNIVIALVILNAVALISGIIFPADIVMATGADGQIESSISELRTCAEGQTRNCAQVQQPPRADDHVVSDPDRERHGDTEASHSPT